jgi:predicted transcriptional regulator
MSSFTLDVRVLRSFVSVVETGSITETARRLGRTQPAITLQMKRLEDLTGKILFKPECRRPVKLYIAFSGSHTHPKPQCTEMRVARRF